MDTNSKVFVAGAGGMVGSAIVRALLGNGYGNIIGAYRSRLPEPAWHYDNAGSALTAWLALVIDPIDKEKPPKARARENSARCAGADAFIQQCCRIATIPRRRPGCDEAPP